MENRCLARMNLIGTRERPGTVLGVPLKRLNGLRSLLGILLIDIKSINNYGKSIPS
jgi:hypothetical protein